MPLQGYLIGNKINVTKTNELNTSSGPILTIAEGQALYDSYKAWMFSMGELQLKIGGLPTIKNEMTTLGEK